MTPLQRQQLRDALLSAFPERSSLEQLLDFELDKKLNHITQDSNLQNIVYQLITTAQAQGWLIDLVRAAYKENPGNSQLANIAREVLTSDISSVESPNITSSLRNKEDGIAKYRKQVEEFAEDSEISFGESEILKDLQKKLKLTEEEVREVRNEVLEPFGIYRENLDNYRQVFTKWVDEQGYPLPEKAKIDLKKLQEYYQLKNEDIALLEKEAEQKEVQRLQQKREQQEASRFIIENSDNSLRSERGIDYTKLQNFLIAEQWKEADYETYLVMLQAVGRSEGDWIRDEELLNFSCTDLRTIDSLWVKYSSGLFGFSIQKQIYLEVGGLLDGKYYHEAWEKFGDRVGWRVEDSWIGYDEVTFNTAKAPRGHLPGGFWCGFWVVSLSSTGVVSSSLALRLAKCNL